jgi:hypothetical protein
LGKSKEKGKKGNKKRRREKSYKESTGKMEGE